VLSKLGLGVGLTPKLVQGESIGQTFNFAKTGNADVGFVAMSQVLTGGRLKEGSMWVIPQTHYAPIKQDAVLLKRGSDNEAAQALMKLLQSPNIKDLIRSYGYDI
jgi:molybdate transport system substrate-binding protein